MAKCFTEDHDNHDSALIVNEGIEQPPVVSPDAIARYKKKRKKLLTVDEFVNGILDGNITILSQAITLIESSLESHNRIGQQVLQKCLPHTGNSVRIGITGVPGVGKSTFIESFGNTLITEGHKIAVLAIDPSSERTKGSILGDKTRMETLSSKQEAFIRPSPSAGSLGGVARKTRESVLLCEAAGFDTILIETVGVGQSETAVHSMVDFFLLLMLAGAGDELQGIKRGIMEMADTIAITKSDGENVQRSELAKAEYTTALQLFPPPPSGWSPGVLTCSSINNKGVADLWNTIKEYVSQTTASNYFNVRRKGQSKYWMHETINESLKMNFYNNESVKESIKFFETEVLEDNVSSFEAARILLEKYFDKISS